VLLTVFKSWINRLEWVIKHEGKYYTQSRKRRDISLRLAEKAGGQELVERDILGVQIQAQSDRRETERNVSRGEFRTSRLTDISRKE
jgi:hypothetical protein